MVGYRDDGQPRVVVGAQNPFDASMKFETLDYCARIEINAARSESRAILTPEELNLSICGLPAAGDYYPGEYGSAERYYRSVMKIYPTGV